MLVARAGLTGTATRVGVGQVQRGGWVGLAGSRRALVSPLHAGRGGAMAPDPQLVGDTFFLDDFAIRQVSLGASTGLV